jgi:hypothetical protein
MNLYESYLHNRLPDIDTLKASVEELNKLDLSKISVEDLKNKLNDCFPILNFGEVIWDSKYHVFRVRRNFVNDFTPYNNLCDIGLPPADKTPFGRANNEFEPIFYGSHEGDLALFECCQNVSEEDRFEPQNFTMGIWKVKANEKLRLVPIIESDEVQKVREDMRRINELSAKQHQEWLTSKKVIEASKIIRKFFADQFAKSNIKSAHDYKISAFFTKTIKDMNTLSTVKFDGILYPSIAYKFKGDNVAIFPSSLYKLELIKFFSIISYNFDFDKGTLAKGITAEGKVLDNESIEWIDKL